MKKLFGLVPLMLSMACLSCNSNTANRSSDATNKAVTTPASTQGALASAVTSCIVQSVCEGTIVSECIADRSRDDFWRDGQVLTLPAGAGRLTASRRALDKDNCLKTAKNCEDYKKCMIPAGAQSCDARKMLYRCEGNTLVACQSNELDGTGYEVRTDCSSLPSGGTCNAETGRCDWNVCTESAENTTCSGAYALACKPDEDFGYYIADCSAANMTCHQGRCVSDKAGCDPTEWDPDCTDPNDCPSVERCNGKYVEQCYLGQQSQWDCSVVHPDFVCYQDNGQAYCGMPPKTRTCDSNYVGGCEGNVAMTCVNGLKVSADCSTFSGATCEGSGDVTYCKAK